MRFAVLVLLVVASCLGPSHKEPKRPVACWFGAPRPHGTSPASSEESVATAAEDSSSARQANAPFETLEQTIYLGKNLELTADGKDFIVNGVFYESAREEQELREEIFFPACTVNVVFAEPRAGETKRAMVSVDWPVGGANTSGQLSTPVRLTTWCREFETSQANALVHMPFGRRFHDYEREEDRPETILILASIHGDESAGTPLVQMLATVLDEDHTLTPDRRVVLVPVVNPDGLAANTRGNANGVDLNRNFDSANWGTSKRAKGGVEPLSEIETNYLVELFERYEPDRVVSLHQPFGLVDFDGPGEAYARAVAEAGGLPVQKLGSRPGSFGSYVGVDHGVPILTIELPADAHRWSDARLWERFGPMMLKAVTWSPGDVESDAGSDGAGGDAVSAASAAD